MQLTIQLRGINYTVLNGARPDELSVVEERTNPDWWPDALSYLARGRKVEAIKHIRGATGLGLKEAKAIADDISIGLDHLSLPYQVGKTYRLVEV